MSDITFECPACSQSLEAPVALSGKKIECPSCKRQIEVPATPSPRKAPDVPSGHATPTSKARSHSDERGKTSHHSPPSESHMTKNQGRILIVLLLIGLGWPFFGWLRPTPTWEYKTMEVLAGVNSSASIMGDNYEKLSYKTIPDISSQLASYGADGWELVGVYLEHETAHPNFGNEDFVQGIQPNTRPQKLVCIFKRQKKI